MNRIIFEKMGEGLQVTHIIHGSNLDSGTRKGESEYFTADPAASIDTDRSLF
jgi:hypothetical protein